MRYFDFIVIPPFMIQFLIRDRTQFVIVIVIRDPSLARGEARTQPAGSIDAPHPLRQG